MRHYLFVVYFTTLSAAHIIYSVEQIAREKQNTMHIEVTMSSDGYQIDDWNK
jgi:hypothetical protein